MKIISIEFVLINRKMVILYLWVSAVISAQLLLAINGLLKAKNNFKLDSKVGDSNLQAKQS